MREERRVNEEEIEFRTNGNKTKDSVQDEVLIEKEQPSFQDLETFLRKKRREEDDFNSLYNCLNSVYLLTRN